MDIALMKSLLDMMANSGVFGFLLVSIVITMLAGIGLGTIISPLIKVWVEYRKAQTSLFKAQEELLESVKTKKEGL
jgi:hypothetical protein